MAVTLERMEKVEERVDRLESLFGQFMTQTGIALRRIDRTVERIEATVAEMKADTARDREESARFRAQSEQDRREMNKRWGELANKMGTLVEDIIAPSLRRIGRDELGCGKEQLFPPRITRRRSDDPKLRREFDALYVGSQAFYSTRAKPPPAPSMLRTLYALSTAANLASIFLNSGSCRLCPSFRPCKSIPIW